MDSAPPNYSKSIEKFHASKIVLTSVINAAIICDKERRCKKSYYFCNSSCTFSPCIDLLHLLSLNQSFSCFFRLVSSIPSSVDPVYAFHPLHVPLPLSKHLPQVVLKHNHITSYYSPLSAYLLLPSIATCSLGRLYFSCQLYTTRRPYHGSFCPFQNSYFIFSQTPSFASI